MKVYNITVSAVVDDDCMVDPLEIASTLQRLIESGQDEAEDSREIAQENDDEIGIAEIDLATSIEFNVRYEVAGPFYPKLEAWDE